MNFAQTIAHLQSAEQELLSLIAQDCSYEEKRRCLEYSSSIHDLIAELSAATPKEAASPIKDAVQRGREEAGNDYPLFFVHDGKLWKVAQRGGSADSLYWKSAPLAEVRLICGALRKMPAAPMAFTIADAEDLLDGVPTYKIQLTVMALLKAGTLQQAGRGKYAFVEGAPRIENKLLDALDSLPAHPELLGK